MYPRQLRCITRHADGDCTILGGNMILDEWKSAQRQRVIRYAHFDRRISLEQCWKYISSPESVAIHAFMPFIHYTITTRKVKMERSSRLRKEKYSMLHIKTHGFTAIIPICWMNNIMHEYSRMALIQWQWLTETILKGVTTLILLMMHFVLFSYAALAV